jgi:molybdopterin-guanine dinucleotide biosynthesis protein A/rhodanese-related sulfurtransferase
VTTALAGAVLTGGRSERMGRDKALLRIDGDALAVRVTNALVAAGAEPVLAVGGDLAALGALGLTAVADPRQGVGPLGGIATALEHLRDHDAVVVLACDLPAVTPAGIAAVVDALGDADVAVPLVAGRLEPLHAAWRPRALPVIEEVLGAGRRAVAAAFDALVTVAVEGLDPSWFANINTAGDVIGHLVGHTGDMTDVREIDVDELATRRETGAYVLDVRQPDEYEEAHVPGAVLIPLDQLEARQAEIPRDEPLLVICRSGGRSATAARALTAAGYDATNVVGGTLAWIDAGFPVAEGSAAG